MFSLAAHVNVYRCLCRARPHLPHFQVRQTHVIRADPPHRMSPTFALLPPGVAHALAVHPRQCLQVLDARASSLPLSHRCGDEPTSMMHSSSACWIFHQPPPLAFSPVASSCFSCTSRSHGIVFRYLRRARPHFRLLVGAATNPSLCSTPPHSAGSSPSVRPTPFLCCFQVFLVYTSRSHVSVFRCLGRSRVLSS